MYINIILYMSTITELQLCLYKNRIMCYVNDFQTWIITSTVCVTFYFNFVNYSPPPFAAKFVNEEDLNDVLCEFDAVIEDFTSPVERRHFRYDEHLKTMKRRSSASVSDSGISDTESKWARIVIYSRLTCSSVLPWLSNQWKGSVARLCCHP